MPARAEGGQLQRLSVHQLSLLPVFTRQHVPSPCYTQPRISRDPLKEMVRLAALPSFGRPQQQPTNLRLAVSLLMLRRTQHVGQREKLRAVVSLTPINSRGVSPFVQDDQGRLPVSARRRRLPFLCLLGYFMLGFALVVFTRSDAKVLSFICILYSRG